MPIFTNDYPAARMVTIAIIGGSGPEGRGLGLRFAIAGHAVVLGSRDAARANEAAGAVAALSPGAAVSGALNADAARAAEWVVLSVPYEGLDDTVRALAPSLDGKMVVSVVAPLAFEGGQPRAVLVPEWSAPEFVQGLVPTAQVPSAFHNLSAKELLKPHERFAGGVIVCGDDAQAKADTVGLVNVIQDLRGVDGGPLSNSRIVEELTALLLYVNMRAKSRATIKLLGLD